MIEYTERQRRFDIALAIILPGILLAFAIFSFAGYSDANFATSYVGYTQIVSMIIVTILPVLRITGKFRAPYWFVFMVTGCLYVHALSLYFCFYQDYSWWSVCAHTIAGVVVSMIVFTGLAVIQTYTRAVNLGVYPLMFMSFIITIGFGTAWELMEWGVDRLAGLQWMSYSIFDTTDDLVADIIGCGITNLGLLYMVKTRKMEDIVEAINFGKQMRVLGAKWDRKCGMDVEVPEPGEMTSIEFGKWENMPKEQRFSRTVSGEDGPAKPPEQL